MEQERHRHVPYDIDVDQALLGSMIVDNRAIEKTSALLRPEHFYDPLHQRLFEAMAIGFERGGMVITPLTLHAQMKADPGLIEVGGIAYLANLAAAARAVLLLRAVLAVLAAADLPVDQHVVDAGRQVREEPVNEELAGRGVGGELALQHHPKLKAALAVGVPHPTLGQEVVVCAVAREGMSLPEAEVRDFLRGRLASYKIPRRVLFFEEAALSLTGNAKIRSDELRGLAAARLRAEAPAAEHTDL